MPNPDTIKPLPPWVTPEVLADLRDNGWSWRMHRAALIYYVVKDVRSYFAPVIWVWRKIRK